VDEGDSIESEGSSEVGEFEYCESGFKGGDHEIDIIKFSIES
jgi:hypothetical protein